MSPQVASRLEDRTGSAMLAPVVTFLISSFNRRDVLLRTLAELARADRSCGVATEVIVIDNASVDGTADAVAEAFPGVRLIRGTENRGACAKNDGLRIARGRFVVFLDDDSYPTADSIGRMIGHFQLRPSLGAAIFDVILPDGSHECSAYPNVFIGCGTGFRREALIQAGGLPDDYFMQAEEYDLSLRLLDAGWAVERFSDLLVHHLKTPGARSHTRTTRLDVRNNLTLIARHFPREWVLPFAVDWMRRYHWIALAKGWRHSLAFWRGLAEGGLRSLAWWRRRPISSDAFETFARIREIESLFRNGILGRGHQTVLLLDVGKNILAYWLAARATGVKIVAIADLRLARADRWYRGIPVVTDGVALDLKFDAAVVANVSPVHAELRAESWREHDTRPVISLLETVPVAARRAA